MSSSQIENGGRNAGPTVPDPPDEDAGLTRSDVFHVLQSWRRREALEFLIASGGQTTLGELADHLADLETEGPVGSTERKRVYVSLYQSHLPKLDDLGIVAFDRSRGTVTALETLDRVRPYLETGDAGEEPRRSGPGPDLAPAAVGGFAGASVCVLVALGLQFGPLLAVPAAVGAGGLVGVLFGRYREREDDDEDNTGERR